MIDGITYYQILGVPEDALLKEIQSAWRTFVKENHEDVVPQFERPAARERMFKINEAYAVLSHEEKRADYDNAHMLNGGSSIELVRRRVRKAREIMKRNLALITGEDMKLIESIIDYLDRTTQEACFDWMTNIVCEHREMARHVVASAFEEQLLGAKTALLDTLLQHAPYAITWEKIHLYGEDICGVSGKEHKERNYDQLARILCHRLDLAKYFVYAAYQEQASGCESCLLPTLLRVAPEEITQKNFDDYLDTVYTMRPIIYGQLRNYNEQAIAWILKARPDLTRKPEPPKAPKELPLPLRAKS
ncbi:MAG: DnaJ domain-containing protein [Nitrospirota bacterium]|nr:DnaJ domain-containing protein [Nitrospirota bacterium]MDH5587435.1 DnaJ domain-containing protein [Nitrospirota bacterium]